MYLLTIHFRKLWQTDRPTTRRTGGVIEKLHIKQRYYNVLLCKYYKKLFCVSNERKSSRSTNLTERNPDGNAANGVKVAGDKLVDGGDAALHVDASRHLRKILQFLHLGDIWVESKERRRIHSQIDIFQFFILTPCSPSLRTLTSVSTPLSSSFQGAP